MRATRLAATALLCIVFLSTVSCATPTYHLSTAVNGQGNILPASGDFMEGRTITVLANPAYGWQFDHWEGALSGDGSLASLTMNSDKNITAYFVVSNGTSTQTQAPEFTTYIDEAVDFSMSVPSSWEDASMGETGAIFMSPSQCSDLFSNCNVLKTEPSGLSLQAYYQASTSLFDSLEDYNLISEDEITINGVPAMEITYSWIMQDTAITTMQFMIVTDQADWVITFTSAPSCWSTYVGTFTTMEYSFEILD